MAFDCELVTCSCYLLLLFGLTQSPSPPYKEERVGGGGGGGELIIGQAALIVWLNSWLIEWEMGGRCCVSVWVREKARWRGGIKPWPHAILVSARGILTQSGLQRALILQGSQLITVSTSLWGSKYTGINTKSSETFVYCIAATEIFIWSGLSLATWIPYNRLHMLHQYASTRYYYEGRGIKCYTRIKLADVEEWDEM